MSMSILQDHVHAACQGPCCILCPCYLSKSMLNIDFGTDTHIQYTDIGHGHAAWKWIHSIDMNLNVLAACTFQCPCSMDMNMQHGHEQGHTTSIPYLFMQHAHVHAASPCLYCIFMSTLHVHVHAAVHVYAACPCSCCMSNLLVRKSAIFY
jgi:hypothetical protein